LSRISFAERFWGMAKFITSILILVFLTCAENLNASILNNVEDPCLRELVNIAIFSESIENEISTLLKIDYNLNDSVNLTIDQTYDLENTIDAITDGYYSSSGALNIHISFNANTLPFTSNEYIMATLYHEFLHAILFYNGVKNGEQHEPIAIGFREILANTLLQHFPTLTMADATALAWAGLQGTKIWAKLRASYKEAIINTNWAYKTCQSGSKL